jgi:D-xylose transport system ATP-binding protein
MADEKQTEQSGAAKAAPASAAPLLELSGVSKRFGAVQALSDVDFTVRDGEVVALVGDNGAGKSTLIKAISGVGPMDDGSMRFDSREVTVSQPSDSADLGIAVVYQDLALCDNLDVVQNLWLGREARVSGSPAAPLDEINMEKRTRTLLDSLAVRTLRSVRAEVGALSGGQRQTVAISRAMLGEPRMVILDEPTAALGVAQTAQVLQLILRLKERGLGVILISDNLGDVFQVCDRVAVLRLGRNAGEYPADDAHRQAVVAAITGADGDLKVGSKSEVTA